MASAWSVLVTVLCAFQRACVCSQAGCSWCQLRVLDFVPSQLVCCSVTFWGGMAKPLTVDSAVSPSVASVLGFMVSSHLENSCPFFSQLISLPPPFS